MSDLRTAAQQALEAWDNDENGTMDHPLSDAMEKIRAALERPSRKWKGLKEWEINDGLDQIPSEDVCSWSFRKGAYFAEKALKERNT